MKIGDCYKHKDNNYAIKIIDLNYTKYLILCKDVYSGTKYAWSKSDINIYYEFDKDITNQELIRDIIE